MPEAHSVESSIEMDVSNDKPQTVDMIILILDDKEDSDNNATEIDRYKNNDGDHIGEGKTEACASICTECQDLWEKDSMISRPERVGPNEIEGGRISYNLAQPYLLNSGSSCHVINDPTGLINIMLDRTKIIVGENLSCQAYYSGELQLH